jgi:outer membrane protein
MKNGLLIWNVLLTIIAGYLLITQLSGKGGKATTTKSSTTDSSNSNQPFRIAYFEMDSVEANYALVKDVKAELSKKEESINGELDRLSKNFQQKYNYFQNQAQSGTMTQPQSETASQELKSLKDQMDSRKQALDQEYGEMVTRRMKDVKKKIEEYLKEYNKTKGYSYIVSYEQELFFYYKDTSYNITSDLVKGLNDNYRVKKD